MGCVDFGLALCFDIEDLDGVSSLPQAALSRCLTAFEPFALLFGMFDIVQLAQAICMEFPFALAFLNFLSLLLENLVTERFC